MAPCWQQLLLEDFPVCPYCPHGLRLYWNRDITVTTRTSLLLMTMWKISCVSLLLPLLMTICGNRNIALTTRTFLLMKIWKDVLVCPCRPHCLRLFGNRRIAVTTGTFVAYEGVERFSCVSPFCHSLQLCGNMKIAVKTGTFVAYDDQVLVGSDHDANATYIDYTGLYRQ